MENRLTSQLIGLGVAQILIGLLCITFQAVGVGIVANSYFVSLAFICHGFWTGIVFIIAGAIGIAGGRKGNMCKVKACNFFSILSALLAVCLMGIAFASAIVSGTSECYYFRCANSEKMNAGIAMDAMLAVLGLIEGIVAIRSSVICCRLGACCCDYGGACCCPLQNEGHFGVTGQPYTGQQQIITANQQPQMFLPNQPPTTPPNWEQLMSLPNYEQQLNINLDSRQRMAQYGPQKPNATP